MLTGKWFEETKIGDAFGASLTVTETHLVLAAGLTGDFNPLHVDETYARGTRMGGRILHGTFTGAIVSAPAGMYFHGTAIAYLEQNCRFKAPVRPGDTLRTTWTIEGREEKPRHGGGIVSMRARCENQDGVLVAEADGKMLVANRPPR
ncbi:MAG: MaoC family dehydratase [Deltaproteobacteria bacterium]|nr:MAG: MaoC family dehydratase [Deltaproteobacteria bacterium]TMB35792.1 MAG: MaoC family dehydratase [Deltaproteobacteria bacterium]